MSFENSKSPEKKQQKKNKIVEIIKNRTIEKK